MKRKILWKPYFGSEVFFFLIETAFMDDKGTDLLLDWILIMVKRSYSH